VLELTIKDYINFFVMVCRLERGQRVTGGKILYVNKRRHGQSSSKNSRLKRVHLLFDEDGNAVSANSERSTVSERVKSFLEAIEKEPADQVACVAPLSSDEMVVDCLQATCDDDEQTSCSNGDINNTVLIDSAQYCLPSTAGATDVDSICQVNTEEADAESERRCDEVNKETGDTAMTVNSDCSVACVEASSDPEISKYWWQRYRLFSRFDSGIRIDRGW